MSGHKDRNLTTRYLVIAFVVYVLNFLIIVASYGDAGQTIAHAIGWQGEWRSFLSHVFFACGLGLVFGQVGCIALWFNLSDRMLTYKIPCLVIAVAQLAVVFPFVMQHTQRGGWVNYAMFVAPLAFVMLGLTSVALRLSSVRIHLVPSSQVTGTKPHVGVSIAQAVFATTIIAVAVALITSGPPENVAWRQILSVVVVGCVVGLLPTTGFMIAISARRMVTQIFASVAFGMLLGLTFSASEHWSLESFALSSCVLSWIVLLPVFWVRSADYLGHAIQCIDRKPKEVDEHPFMEDEFAQEASL